MAITRLRLRQEGGKLTRLYVIAVILLFVSASPAAAYIDPVTGSIVVQALLGGAAAALVSVRRWRNKLLGLFRNKKFDSQRVDRPGGIAKDGKDGQ